MKNEMEIINEHVKRIKEIDLNYLKSIFENKKKYKISENPDYDKGYYAGFQEAINIFEKI